MGERKDWARRLAGLVLGCGLLAVMIVAWRLVSDAATGASTMDSTTKRGNASRRRTQQPYSPNSTSGAVTTSSMPA